MSSLCYKLRRDSGASVLSLPFCLSLLEHSSISATWEPNKVLCSWELQNYFQLLILHGGVHFVMFDYLTERNDPIFKGLQPSVQKCKGNFRKELSLLCFRIKSSSKPSFVLWLDSFYSPLFRSSLLVSLNFFFLSWFPEFPRLFSAL